MELYYQSRTGCPVHGVVHLSDKQDKPPKLGIDEKAFKHILNTVQKEDKFVNPDLFSHSYRHFEKAISQVMNTEKDMDRKHKYIKALRNTARFSAYKTAHQVYELRKLNPKDKDYHKKAQSINNKYNNVWLNTEYVHTVRSAGAIKKWQQYQADKDLYPYLEYRPSRAAEPRNEHKKLYGVIKPVDDKFWDTWMPPSDWGCKCSVRQVRSNDKAKEPPENIKKPPAAIRNNPGKNGIIFTDNHPMIKRVKAQAKYKINAEIELTKDDIKPVKLLKGKKGTLYIHPFFHGKDFKDNIYFAKEAIDEIKGNLIIKRHIHIDAIEKDKSTQRKINIKNNEFQWIYKQVTYEGDLFTRDKSIPKNTIRNAFKHKYYGKNAQLAKYKKTFIAIDLKQVKKTENIDLFKQLQREVKKYKNVFYIILKMNSKYKLYSRNEILKKNFRL